ncbi:MAG TPA: SIR2 family protein [Mycobacteriales bacterium]|nr:SIR2 family protein [Mycobacteriales bacterium]
MEHIDCPGHVFVVHGDLTRLACDDVLVPTDRRLEVAPSWLPLLPADLVAGDGESGRRLALEPTSRWREGARVLPVDPGEGRRLWLVDTGDEQRDIDWLLAGVDEFVAAVTAAEGRAPVNARERRLVGVPAVGTGGGSAAGDRGRLIKELLPRLCTATDRCGFDVVLVLDRESDCAAAQRVRRALDLPWPVSDQLYDAAQRLAARVRTGEWAIFLGAGVSAAAGVPVWSELLDGLSGRAGCSDEERALLEELAPQDAASVLARRIGDDELAAYVARRFAERPHALAHALLADLPVREFVTTNYDPLFESAARAIRRDLRVLPFDTPGRDAPWLLKLHGDVGRPDSVVLTREEYLHFQEDLGALAGVVHALLLTRHVLFVGVSLLDDNVIRIAHEVRRVLRHRASDRERHIGTALALTDHPIRAQLWAEDLDYVPMAPRGTRTASAARRLEIFLDLLAMLAAPPTGYLLDAAYDGMLSAGERDLARALRRLPGDAHGDARESPAWCEVEQLLRRLGADVAAP